MYAKVIVDISHEQVDRPFEYRIPDELEGILQVGMSVSVPFGRGNSPRSGYVIEIVEKPEFDPLKIKDILGISEQDVQVENNLIRLAWWMKNRYGATMIQCLKTVVPAKQKVKPREEKDIVRLMSSEMIGILYLEAVKKKQTAKARLLFELRQEEVLPCDLVRSRLHISSSTITSLEKAGVIRVETRTVFRKPIRQEQDIREKKTLSASQQNIVDTVFREFDEGLKRTYLIHGITGSGKTEVYIRLARETIKRGRSVIVLIPEIALTYQTVMRFYHHFGDRVSVINSALSAGEKYDQCERARCGDIDIIIGPRSALFAPFKNLGLIIIDEEHEASYKSETMPKYHARETAEYLAGMHGASVVLGSATPSMESYYRARNGLYGLFTLNERLTGNVLPEVEISDLREELRAGNRTIFSRSLQEKIAIRLEKGEQIMLFLNRRGYAGFVSCRSCGHVMKCPHCDVSLSEHMGGRLHCHYCGYTQPSVRLCPECGSKYILGFKAGTEAIVEKLNQMYPKARILRMDADTTGKKDSYEKILSAFADHQADILVGTQMIVKGHDFPGVTLVGVLAADMSLFSSDYRSGERTFQLLTQAAGRAGRGDRPGEVVIQTYQPEHYSIRHAAKQDYSGFYEEEIVYRQLLHYPPAEHMMAVLVLSPDEKLARDFAQRLKTETEKCLLGDKSALSVIGPAEASIGRIQDIYRFTIYFKSASLLTLTRARACMEGVESTALLKNVTVQYDLDPMSGY